MRPSQLRQHPLQRAADAAAVLTTQRQQQLAAPAVAGPAHNDLADPLTGLQQQPEEEAPWTAAYGRLALRRLPKTLKVFGWRLLHNGLWVGARKMHFRPAAECLCCQEVCQQQQPVPLQTLSHVLLECPVAREVWEWFVGKWRQLVPSSSVVAGSPRVFLLDELAADQVAQELRPLWTHLRLLLLESLWVGRAMWRVAGPHSLRPVFSSDSWLCCGSRLRMIGSAPCMTSAGMRVYRLPGSGGAALSWKLRISSSCGVSVV